MTKALRYLTLIVIASVIAMLLGHIINLTLI